MAGIQSGSVDAGRSATASAAPSQTTPPPPSTNSSMPAASPVQSQDPVTWGVGPWTGSEFIERMKSPYFVVAADMSGKETLGKALNGAGYESLPLTSELEHLLSTQAEGNSYQKKIVQSVRITGNRGSSPLTPYKPSCEEDNQPTSMPFRPGFYVVVPLTDEHSRFTGKSYQLPAEDRYALIRADCSSAASTPAAIPPYSPAPADLTFNTMFFQLPIRPDGTWDKASMAPLGIVMVDSEGRVAVLEN
jgi:hypothetical protein